MKIGIIGVGNIGGIFVEQLRKDETITLNLYDKKRDKIGDIEGDNIIICSTTEMVCKDSELLIVAVKPQDSISLLNELKKCEVSQKTIISTITGISLDRIHKTLKTENIARIMPNVPAAIGKGVTGVCFYDTTKKEAKSHVDKILRELGSVVEIEEKDFPAVTALSGSGPAFAFVIIESLIDIGLKMGLSYEKSRELVIGTLIGSAELLSEKGNHPGEFRHLVTSPAGTTIEGIYSLERDAFRGTIMKAIYETYQRAVELSDEIEKGL